MYERYGLGEHVEVGEELSIPAELIWERIVDGAHEMVSRVSFTLIG